jgi:hypothetical protein
MSWTLCKILGLLTLVWAAENLGFWVSAFIVLAFVLLVLMLDKVVHHGEEF